MLRNLIVSLILTVLLVNSVCSGETAVLNAFNSGELSPLLEGRSDVKKYYSGCRVLENMVVLPHGGVTKRPGTYYIADAKSSSAACRLIAFEHSIVQAYILEFGHEYIRFYKDGGQIASGIAPYEVTTTYDGNDVFELQLVQSADVLYIAHPDYAPRSLSRTAHTSWTLSVIEFERGPFLDENDTDITIAPPTSPTDVTSSETHSASDTYSIYTAAKAFDDVVTGVSGWLADAAVTDQWIKIQYAAAKTITRMRIQPCGRIGYSSRDPNYCKLEGSNNDSTWTKIPAVKWLENCEAYDTNEIKLDEINNYTDWADIEFTNTTAYTYYRLWCYDNYGDGTYIGLKEIEMFEGQSTTYTASDDIFTEEHIDSVWKITHTVDSNETSGAFTEDGNSTPYTIQFKRKYDFTIGGVWTGTCTLQRSYDNGTVWKDVYPFTHLATTDGNFAYSDSEEVEDASYRVLMANFGGTSCLYSLTARSHDIDGIIKITGWTSETEVTASVLETLSDTAATKYWAEGAWSDDEGYPSCIAFYEERQVYAATTNQPQTIWMSQTGDWNNFLAGADDTDAITITIAADQVNAIRWLSSQTALLIGTTGGEWKLSATEEDEPLTPTNVNAKRQSSYGSANIQAIGVNNLILYVQRQRQKVRKLQYSWELDNWIAPDLTLLSEHITGDGVSQLAIMKNPYPILWCVRDDGTLIGVTLEESNEVIGWHRHTFSGNVESVAVIPGDAEDEVWISVEREIDDSTVRYIEQMQSFDWGSDQADCFFVDSGLTFDGDDTATITNITQAYPAVVTASAHGFEDGEQIRFSGIEGMTIVNNKVFTVGTTTTDTFTLRDKRDEVDIDSRGLVAHWKMNDNAANTVVEDVYDHDGVAGENTEAMSVAGQINSALCISDHKYIIVDDHNDFSFGDGSDDEPFSIALWMQYVPKVSPYYGDNNLVAKKYTFDEYKLFLYYQVLYFRLYDDSAGWIGRKTDSTVPLSDIWYHIIITYDGSESATGITMYINGDEEDSSAESSGSYTAMENTTQDIHIGAGGRGNLDDVRIFNKVLTAHEIKTLYKNGKGTEKEVGWGNYVSGSSAEKVEDFVSGLDHLEGETVAVLQNGGDAGTQTVTDGTISLDDFYFKVQAGLPITARLQPMKLEMQTKPGSLFGIPKRITEVTVRFYKTSGCDIGPSWSNYDTYLFRDARDTLDAPTPLYSGDKTIEFDADYELSGNICIQSQLPLPLTISALMALFEVSP